MPGILLGIMLCLVYSSKSAGLDSSKCWCIAPGSRHHLLFYEDVWPRKVAALSQTPSVSVRRQLAPKRTKIVVS